VFRSLVWNLRCSVVYVTWDVELYMELEMCILLWFGANTSTVIILWMWFVMCMNLMYESGFYILICYEYHLYINSVYESRICIWIWNLYIEIQSDLIFKTACGMCLTQAARTRNRLWCVSIASGCISRNRLWCVSITSDFRLTAWDVVLHHRQCTISGSWNRLCRG
jgi:hypothetical protein